MNIKSYFRSAGRILRLLQKENPWLCFALCLNTLLAGITPTVDAYGLKRIIEICSQPSPVFSQTIPWIVLILLSSALMAVAGLLHHKLSEIGGQMLLARLRRGMMDKMARIDLSRFDRTEFKNRYQQALGQINGNLTSILVNLLNALKGVVTFVSFAIMLGRINWWLLIAEVALSVPLLILSLRREDRFFGIAIGRTPVVRKLNYYAETLISPKEQPELRVFGGHGLFRKKYEESYNEHLSSVRQAIGYDNRTDALKAALTVLGLGFAYVVLVLQIIRGTLTVADLTLAVSASAAILAGGATISGNFAAAYRIVLFFGKYDEFMQSDTDMPTDCPAEMPVEVRRIAFSNVTFRYPGMDRDVLKDVSFVLEAGQATALVGVNGAGKSTIIKLLLRIYQPDSGVITLNDTNIAEIPLETYYRSISTILQGYAQYALTLEESVLFGNGGDLQAALQAADLSDFPAQAPGCGTVALTRQFDPEGVQPSGGQWQKIALARAFAKSAPVLLLDEPSAALDPAAECSLYENIFRESRNKITLFVSHRLISTVFADKILLLKDGRIEESGTHDQLISKGGAYAEMFSAVERLYRMRKETDALEAELHDR